MNRLKSSASKIGQSVAFAVAVSAMIVVPGCGDDSGLGRRYKVSGKVTYKGVPVPKGTVNFIPIKPPVPEGRAASGQIKDGYYSLATAGSEDGALPGEYGIAIVSMDIDLTQALPKDGTQKIREGDPAYQKAIKAAKRLIPQKYGLTETSGLKATVDSSGKSIDFDLKDD